jgi:hypothetical protein
VFIETSPWLSLDATSEPCSIDATAASGAGDVGGLDGGGDADECPHASAAETTANQSLVTAIL